MKTITEFNGFNLKAALAKRDELTSAGKTAEELPAAMGEAYKLEGDKLKLFLNALELYQARPDRLKRIIVLSLAEGEKAPPHAEKKDEQYYLSEFFPAPPGQERGRRGQGPREGRGERRGGKRGERGEKRAKGRRGERGPRRERDQAQALMTSDPSHGTLKETPKGAEGGERAKRPRKARPPRKPNLANAPQGTKTIPRPKDIGGSIPAPVRAQSPQIAPEAPTAPAPASEAPSTAPETTT